MSLLRSLAVAALLAGGVAQASPLAPVVPIIVVVIDVIIDNLPDPGDDEPGDECPESDAQSFEVDTDFGPATATVLHLACGQEPAEVADAVAEVAPALDVYELEDELGLYEMAPATLRDTPGNSYAVQYREGDFAWLAPTPWGTAVIEVLLDEP